MAPVQADPRQTGQFVIDLREQGGARVRVARPHFP
jgi:hypothetical protein